MDERVSDWLNDKISLKKSYDFYLKKNIVRSTDAGNNLVVSHLNKAKYNIEFSYFLLKENKYLDWCIVGLYYAVYHSSLSLLIRKGFISKNHTATLCFLVYYFTEFGEEDIELFKDLILKEEEVKFYTTIKDERQKASYSTKFNFTKDSVEGLRFRTLKYIQKIEKLLEEI